jgi:hypothetical protein
VRSLATRDHASPIAPLSRKAGEGLGVGARLAQYSIARGQGGPHPCARAPLRAYFVAMFATVHTSSR